MNTDVHLSAEDFSKLHNAMCKVRHVQAMLEGVVNDKVINEIKAAISDYDAVMAPAYAADWEAFEKASEAVDNFAEKHGLKTRWSIYEHVDFAAKHPFENASHVEYDGGWGEPSSALIEGVTWGHLYIAADKAIRMSGDTHHTFIEGFTQDGRDLHLATGS